MEKSNKPVTKRNIKKHKCIRCKNLFPESKITFAADPYNSEINNDNTEVWECEECRNNCAMDI